jgi:hypothetical protein
MRENRLSGSEGGGAELNRLSLPLSKNKTKSTKIWRNTTHYLLSYRQETGL